MRSASFANSLAIKLSPAINNGVAVCMFFATKISRPSQQKKIMDEYLKKNFEIPSKNATPEQKRDWRSRVFPVKNPTRRFRNVADLDKRLEAEERKKEIREKLKAKRAQME